MSIEIKTVTLEITDGPSRDTLFDSMKYNYEARIQVDFKIIKGSSPLVVRDVEIHTIQHEDGTGFKFNLEGYLDVKAEGGYVPRKFKAFYNAKNRKGTVTLKKF